LIIAGIPAYNEEKTIAKVVLLAQKYVDFVIVCDDGSQDLTGEIAQKLGAFVIRHGRNMGYGAALQSIFEKARTLNADVLVTLDADGQHDTADIPNLAQTVADGKADVVIGSRFLESKKEVPFYRSLGIRALTRLTNGNSKRDENNRITDAQCGFRAYSRQAIESLTLYGKGMGISAEILLKARSNNLKVLEVPVQVYYKNLETSTHNFLVHGLSVIMTIIRVVAEERPLIFLGIPSLASIIIGFFLGLWALQLYTSGQGVIMSVALVAATFLIIGVFMLFTAITLYAIARTSEREKARK
jgi:glycosyltransferase involved in cell wall biosynthesis